MPAKRITVPGAAKPEAPPAAVPAVRSRRKTAVLPGARSVPSETLSDYTWCIHGDPKIGKTSLVAQFEDVLFMMFEPGGKALSVFQTPTILDWADVNDYIAELEADAAAGRSRFRAVCFDTGSRAYERCMEWVIRTKLGGSHPGKVEDFGASWKEVSSAFINAHSRIAALGLGFFVTAHSRATERQRRTGERELRIEPMFGGTLDEFYRGVIDVIAYYHYAGENRFLQIRGDDTVVAGCRLAKNFLTPKGEPIVRVPMGGSPEEGYDNLLRAFRNEQELTYSGLNPIAPSRRRVVKVKD